MKKHVLILILGMICLCSYANDNYDEIYHHIESLSASFKVFINTAYEADSTADIYNGLENFKNDFEQDLQVYSRLQEKYGDDVYLRSEEYPEKLNKLIDEFEDFFLSEKLQKSREILEAYSEDPMLKDLLQELDFMFSSPAGYLALQYDNGQLVDFLKKYISLTRQKITDLAAAESSAEYAQLLHIHCNLFEQLLEEAETIERLYPGFRFSIYMSYEKYNIFPEEVRRIIDEYSSLHFHEIEKLMEIERKKKLYKDSKEISKAQTRYNEIRDQFTLRER